MSVRYPLGFTTKMGLMTFFRAVQGNNPEEIIQCVLKLTRYQQVNKWRITYFKRLNDEGKV